MRKHAAVAQAVVTAYDGDARRLWEESTSGEELLARLTALPGFGRQKGQIFVALLAKRMGVAPPGWEQAAGVFSDDEPRSAADCSSPETLAQVRSWKKMMKAAKKDKQGRDVA